MQTKTLEIYPRHGLEVYAEDGHICIKQLGIMGDDDVTIIIHPEYANDVIVALTAARTIAAHYVPLPSA